LAGVSIGAAQSADRSPGHRVIATVLPLSGPASGKLASGMPLSIMPASGMPLSTIPASGMPLSSMPASGVPASGALTGSHTPEALHVAGALSWVEHCASSAPIVQAPEQAWITLQKGVGALQSVPVLQPAQRPDTQ
jgi:hypothetical protein